MKWFCVLMVVALVGCGQQLEYKEKKYTTEPPDTPGEGAKTNAPETKTPKPQPAAAGVKQKDLEKRDAEGNVVGFLEEGLWFQRGEKEPFTGTVVGMYKSGQKESEKQFKEGRLEGLEVHWYENGEKRWEIVHKDGAVVDRKAWSPDGELQP